MMNYVQFLTEVDERISGCEEQVLRAFIHELARTWPEEERSSFLSTLGRIILVSAEDGSQKKEESEEFSDEREDFEDELADLFERLEDIQDGNRSLDSEINEEWDDWYNSDEEEFIFEDPEDILPDIEEAIETLHDCLDREAYEDGAVLGQRLSELTVLVSGEYDDEMSLNDLFNHGLLEGDMSRIMREAVYLSYMGNEEEDRAEAMVTVMEGFNFFSFTLEDILRMGREEIELKAFLPSWIEALSGSISKSAEPLLIEALHMLEDKESILTYARRFADTYPNLYKSILEEGIPGVGDEELLSIGLQSLTEVPDKSQVKSEIALLCAGYALREGDIFVAEDCWMEAFRCAPSVSGFLRLRLESRHYEDYAGKIREAYESYFASKGDWAGRGLALFLYFDGRFEEMIRRFMNAGNGIGWSSTFMKQGIALLLMLLYGRGEYRRGMAAMREKALYACSFSKEAYCLGTEVSSEISNGEFFQDCFDRWKASLSISEEQAKAWLDQIDRWILLRVEAIMNANKRNYYEECAGFVAAYGEVLESRGEAGATLRVLRQFKMLYPRRRAFHQEMQAFGLR